MSVSVRLALLSLTHFFRQFRSHYSIPHASFIQLLKQLPTTMVRVTPAAAGMTMVFAALVSLASSQCTPEKLAESINACDSLVHIAQIKCDSKACHKALHVLVEADYIECYVQLGLGAADDLAKYKALDDFCHGEGPDPYEASEGTAVAGSTSTAGSGSAGKSPDVVKDDSVSTVPSPAAPTPTTATAPSPTPSSAAASVVVASTTVVSAVALSLAVGL